MISSAKGAAQIRGLRPTASGCQFEVYHVWFATKRLKWMLRGDIAEKVKESVRQVARQRDIQLIEFELMPDHVHLLLPAESEVQLSWYLKLLKGRSAHDVFRSFPDLKLDAHTKNLWQDGFGARRVPPEQLTTGRRYIRTQDERLDNYVR